MTLADAHFNLAQGTPQLHFNLGQCTPQLHFQQLLPKLLHNYLSYS